MGSFEFGVLVAARERVHIPVYPRLHPRVSAPQGPAWASRPRRARTGAAQWPPGQGRSQIGVSPGQTLGSHGHPRLKDPHRPQYCSGLKLTTPTISWRFFALCRAALVQVHRQCEASRWAPAPRPRQLPRPRAARRSAASEPSVGPGRHLRALRAPGAAAATLSPEEPAPPPAAARARPAPAPRRLPLITITPRSPCQFAYETLIARCSNF